MNRASWAGIAILLALMCFASVGILIGLTTFSSDTDRATVIGFLMVASFPFICVALVLISRVKQVAPPVLFGLTAVAFLAFIAAIDFANGRELYSGLDIFWNG